MSFSKAQDLIRLARMAAARRGGISLDDICEEFAVSHRTAQRMTVALEETFAHVEVIAQDDRRRRWRLTDPGLAGLQLRYESGVEALEIAARAAEAEGRLRHARALVDLRDGVLTRAPGRARVEADAEAVLMAMGQVTRPGPRVTVAPDILDAIIEALRGRSACASATIPTARRVSSNRMACCWGTAPILPRAIRPRPPRCAIFASTSSTRPRP